MVEQLAVMLFRNELAFLVIVTYPLYRFVSNDVLDLYLSLAMPAEIHACYC